MFSVTKLRLEIKEGVWLSKENEIKEGLVRAFRSLLSNPGDWRTSLSELQVETLETLDVLSLEELFSEEDVFGALLGCSGDKALEGLTIILWHFVNSLRNL